MPNQNYRFLALFISVFSLFFFFPSKVFAARTINSATLNGGSSVTVAPSTVITAQVNVTTTSGGGGANWQGTSWTVNGSTTCVDHANHNGAGSYSESFSITAPGSNGSYSVSFIAYSNNACSTQPSSTYTLTDGIVVSTPTSPSPTPSPSPSPSPGTSPTPSTTPSASPTPGTTSTGSSSSSGTAPAIDYPAVSLTSYTPNPTNKTSLSFSGSASISNGSIAEVEYSLTNGAEWYPAVPTDGTFNSAAENFWFNPRTLSEGVYTIQVRAKSAAGIVTQSGSYATDSVTIITTPPTVILNQITPNPTKDTQPTITGTATSQLGQVTRVEVSLDGGKSFSPTTRRGSAFTITTDQLEDGNYALQARAFDNAGNVGLSSSQTLIIDTVPPIIGGSSQSLGPQVLLPNSDGTVSVAAGTKTAIAVSMKGGVTNATVKSGDQAFVLSPLTDTNIWVGTLSFEESGDKQLMIEAIDGALNNTTRTIFTTKVENFGAVVDKQSQAPIAEATVTVFFQEAISGQWLPWEAASYGQTNPQQSDASGNYSFMLPPGKYYVDVKAPGFRHAQTTIVELAQTSIINQSLPLKAKPTLNIQLPVWGKVSVSLPQLSPPDSIAMSSPVTSPLPTASTFVATSSAGTKLSLNNMQSQEVQLNAYLGKKVLLTFLSPWSSLSQDQAPFLEAAHQQVGEDEVVVAVMLQEGVSSTQAFMRRGGYTFPILADKDGLSANLFQVQLLPHHVVINSQGSVVGTKTGVLNTAELLQYLNTVQ